MSLPSFSLSVTNSLEGLHGSGEDQRAGKAGFIGTTLIMFGFFSMMWALVDPATNKDIWMILVCEYFGGLIISLGFGFQMKGKVSARKEIPAIMLALAAGSIMIGTNFLISQIGAVLPLSIGTEGLWLIMLAPVAESLAFDIAIYHWFRNSFPEIHWAWIALPSNCAFALFHFFRYGMDPQFIVILVILFIGNTILIYFYDMTRIASVPILAHTMVNFATAPIAILEAIQGFIYLFVIMFAVILVVYMLVQMFTRRNQ